MIQVAALVSELSDYGGQRGLRVYFQAVPF